MSLAERITRHYRGDWNKGASQGNIPGEGHSQRDRSVSVKDAPDRPDGILICVRGSGDWKAEMDRFRRDGLIADLEPQHVNSHGCGGEWKCTGTYEYDDGAGNILYRTRRLEKAGEKKRFVAERLEGGRWVNGLGETRRVPYRLTQIGEALSSAALTDKPFPPIYFVEGERKADKLAGWGLLATAIAFGAGGWRDEYAQITALVDAPIVILPDNDSKGREFAEAVAASIIAAGGRAHILELPGLPEKGDIVDWGGNLDELRRLTDDAISGKKDLLPLADLAVWAGRSPKAKPFVLAGRIPRQEITLLSGDGGTNKSTFGEQLATCWAAGQAILGIDMEGGKSLYVTAEDDFDRLEWVHKHMCEAVGVPRDSLADRLFLSSVRGVPNNELAVFDGEGRIRPTAAFARLRATIAATGVDLLVLDNVAHMFAGNENDRAQVTAFVNLLYSLCRDLGTTILLIAHRNKAGDSYSGSTAWLNAVRSQLVIERPENALNVDDRELSVGKANYARPDEKLLFRWADFALWLHSDLPSDSRSELDDLLHNNGAATAFIRCLREREKQGPERAVGPAPGPNYAPTQFERMAEAKGYKKEKLARAMEQLFAIGKIETYTYRNKAKSRDVTIIQEVAEDFPNARPNPPRTPIPNDPERSEMRHHTHTVDTTYQMGAALGTAAPDDEDVDWVQTDGGEGD